MIVFANMPVAIKRPSRACWRVTDLQYLELSALPCNKPIEPT
jgi:hypothetical protein